MRQKFELTVDPLGNKSRLLLDEQELPCVTDVSLHVPARGLSRMVVQQTMLDGHATGEAEVQLLRRMIGSPPVPKEPASDEAKDAVRELADKLLGRAPTADVVGGGTVTLEDGRKAHYLYVVDHRPVQPGVSAAEFAQMVETLYGPESESPDARPNPD